MPANNDKPTMLLLSDDLRMNSGIATMSRELVLSTVHKYNWVQLAGAINHPEKGKVFDLSQSTNDMKKMTDAYVKVYPVDGYGNEQTLFQVIAMEQPKAILHFTDPRFWGWLYALEHQIRSTIPICYLNIWDANPYPMYNRGFYESCDALFSISKQTMNINKWVLGPEKCCAINGIFDMGGSLLSNEKEWIMVNSDWTKLDFDNLEQSKESFIQSFIKNIPEGAVSPNGTTMTPDIIRQSMDNIFTQFLKRIHDKNLSHGEKMTIFHEVMKPLSQIAGSAKTTANE